MRRKLAAGNWKMNGTQVSLAELAAMQGMSKGNVETLICPPATLIYAAAGLKTGVTIGAQDCHAGENGAHTGDLSAMMLADAGAAYVITGHSERRQDHGETDGDVLAKTEAAWAAGLKVILCIGESEAQREDGSTLEVLATQLKGSVPEGATGSNLVIAYEPIWAIGTGKVPTVQQITEVHRFLRTEIASRFGDDIAGAMRLLYGGSVKASNAAEIFAVEDVDGALVGGASLKATDFMPIVSALNASPTAQS
ncbi:MAG: triose-phosphate isomerase [Rhodobacterales bacterium]